MPRSLADAGVSREDFEAAVPELLESAFSDPSVRTNPRMPMIAELAGLLQAGFEGRPEPGARAVS